MSELEKIGLWGNTREMRERTADWSKMTTLFVLLSGVYISLSENEMHTLIVAVVTRETGVTANQLFNGMAVYLMLHFCHLLTIFKYRHHAYLQTDMRNTLIPWICICIFYIYMFCKYLAH